MVVAAAVTVTAAGKGFSMDSTDQTDYAEILANGREAEREALAEWEAIIVTDIAEHGAQLIDWDGTPEGDLVTDTMADAADMNLGLPLALMVMALREAGFGNEPRITRALQEVCLRYRNDGYKGY